MTSEMFTNYFDIIISDIRVFMPYVLIVFSIIWGLKIAFSTFRKIAR